jgi:hypothetical protein
MRRREMPLSKDKLRAVINMLADEKQAHAAAHVLRTQAAENKVLVVDYILNLLVAEDLAFIRAKLKEVDQERQRQERERQQRERQERERQERGRQNTWTDVGDENFNPRGGHCYLVDIHYETERAYLIGVNPDIWIPKSQSRLIGDNGHGKCRLWIKDWIAREKDIRHLAE